MPSELRASRVVGAVLAAVALLVVRSATDSGAATTGGSAPSPANQGRAVVLTFNMCGEHCDADRTGADIDDLMSKVNTYQPDAVLLQEVCHDQFEALKAMSHQPGEWQLYGRSDTTEPRGCGGDSFGDAVLTHTSGTVDLHTRSLRYVHGSGANRQTRKVMCLRSPTAFPRTTEFCTVHAGLAYEIGKAHQAAQIKQAYVFARRQDPTAPLILGGDFNVTPSANALDPVYAGGGRGASGVMQEVDACPGPHGRSHHSSTCNQRTHDRTPQVHHRAKNDFTFGSRKSFKALSGTVVASPYSDHDMLVGDLYECAFGVC
jgi:endonuclease/exonuclease/phosphatase family metal-dependent hydrolase